MTELEILSNQINALGFSESIHLRTLARSLKLRSNSVKFRNLLSSLEKIGLIEICQDTSLVFRRLYTKDELDAYVNKLIESFVTAKVEVVTRDFEVFLSLKAQNTVLETEVSSQCMRLADDLCKKYVGAFGERLLAQD